MENNKECECECDRVPGEMLVSSSNGDLYCTRCGLKVSKLMPPDTEYTTTMSLVNLVNMYSIIDHCNSTAAKDTMLVAMAKAIHRLLSKL